MDNQRMQENGEERGQANDMTQEARGAAEQNTNEKKSRRGRKRKRKGMTLLHVIQHAALAAAAMLIVLVLSGSYLMVETRNGPEVFSLIGQERDISFEESDIFNSLLGNSVSDVICYGAIRGQLETDGRFDAGKEIDVTAFADRYRGVQPEYITARYYLDDLIKWNQAGFIYEDVYMSSEEVDEFLSRSTTVTKVNLDEYSGGTVSCLNSDLSGATTVEDVSGNLLETGTADREAVSATVLGNRYHTVEGKNIENYVSTWDEYYDLCHNVERASEALYINYGEYLNYRDLYDSGKSNVVYFIKRTVGEDTQVFSNLDGDLTQTSRLMDELKEQCGKYVYYNQQDMQFETNTLIEESTLRYILNGYDYAYPADTQVMIGVRTRYDARDCFYQADAGFHNYVPYVWQYVIGAVICIFIYLFLLAALTMKEGVVRKKDNEEIVIRLLPEDRIPTELMILAAGVAAFVLYYGIKAVIRLLWQTNDSAFAVVVAGSLALLVSLLFSFFYYSFVRRIRAKNLWRESLLRRFGRFAKKWGLYAYDHSNVILRVWVPVAVFAVLNVGGAFLLGYADLTINTGKCMAGILLLLAIDGAAGYILYRSALAKQQILKGIELIREGNLAHKVDEEGLHGEDLVLARAVNSIGDSVRAAVETSMKDERLKADLITNVSHDIKTPLTSIINYVDLIKRENVDDPRIREYIEVLDVKSQRLKQLTDDLVEASKISSGNIVLQYEKINLVELLNQTIGEFSEKFEEKSLYPVFHAPKGSVYIEADSRRIWRVIENLFNNIFKYALANTRVYIDLAYLKNDKERRQVMLSVKNISAQPLKVAPEELTERFIRGDESRTTEGSGLGLSIAKNLTEAQKGKFEIVMDGDLFKVNLIFPLIDE